MPKTILANTLAITFRVDWEDYRRFQEILPGYGDRSKVLRRFVQDFVQNPHGPVARRFLE